MLSDRECDKWDALLALADVAGGEWPVRARAATLAFTAADATDFDFSSYRRLLLTDIRDIFRGYTLMERQWTPKVSGSGGIWPME